MGRLLGIDYGDKRVGLAISDPTGTIASALDTILFKSTEDLFQQLKERVVSEDIAGVVVGMPFGMKGQVTAQTETVQQFITELRGQLSISVDSAVRGSVLWKPAASFGNRGISRAVTKAWSIQQRRRSFFKVIWTGRNSDKTSGKIKKLAACYSIGFSHWRFIPAVQARVSRLDWSHPLHQGCFSPDSLESGWCGLPYRFCHQCFGTSLALI